MALWNLRPPRVGGENLPASLKFGRLAVGPLSINRDCRTESKFYDYCFNYIACGDFSNVSEVDQGSLVPSLWSIVTSSPCRELALILGEVQLAKKAINLNLDFCRGFEPRRLV